MSEMNPDHTEKAQIERERDERLRGVGIECVNCERRSGRFQLTEWIQGRTFNRLGWCDVCARTHQMGIYAKC